jgi:plasmid maintenance system killer protein
VVWTPKGKSFLLLFFKKEALPFSVIKSFRHRGLAALWNDNDASKLDPSLADAVRRRLDALQCGAGADLAVPGFHLHRRPGKPARHSVKVDAAWCLTFKRKGQDAHRVDLEPLASEQA